MIDWPEELIDVLARRRCVIVIGAGVSKNSTNRHGKRPATWEEFLKNCAEGIPDRGCIDELLEKQDYLTSCEVIKNKLTNDVFINKVQAEYQSAGYIPAEIHKAVYLLDSPIVLSPNFDQIYDTYALAESSGTVVIKDHTSQDTANYLLGGEIRLILKTHGSANNPQNLIFTRADYAEARTKYVLFYEILKSLALTHTFFFIGCGTDDPDIRMLFEDIQFAHGRLPFHYMTLPDGEVHNDVMDITNKTMRIKFVNYSPSDYHVELTESLQELVQKVEDLRTNHFSKSLNW
ncbi:SIR2 family protein [Vibrio alginolyticus]|uniref:SIR2 family protein n=1 Tax=Vibrio alginolyticus TaxID=663 RepID=UPI001C9CCC39|nr:SIR2 family protein [Vibrio alginolyticus]ELI5395235.1 SIR2 family protein [Vibrio parahaemolyticus]MBY7682300.1 SIR2 family protein [Vibrio alginolyticus]